MTKNEGGSKDMEEKKGMRANDNPLEALEGIAQSIYNDLDNGNIPALSIPSRTKKNIKFHPRLGVWKYGSAKTQRVAKTLDGAYMLLRTMYLSEFIGDMIKNNKSSTLREMYYISEAWEMAKFGSQDESNRLAEDLEIMTMHMRESLRLRPEEDGARVMGKTVISMISCDAVHIQGIENICS